MKKFQSKKLNFRKTIFINSKKMAKQLTEEEINICLSVKTLNAYLPEILDEDCMEFITGINKELIKVGNFKLSLIIEDSNEIIFQATKTRCRRQIKTILEEIEFFCKENETKSIEDNLGKNPVIAAFFNIYRYLTQFLYYLEKKKFHSREPESCSDEVSPCSSVSPTERLQTEHQNAFGNVQIEKKFYGLGKNPPIEEDFPYMALEPKTLEDVSKWVQYFSPVGDTYYYNVEQGCSTYSIPCSWNQLFIRHHYQEKHIKDIKKSLMKPVRTGNDDKDEMALNYFQRLKKHNYGQEYDADEVCRINKLNRNDLLNEIKGWGVKITPVGGVKYFNYIHNIQTFNTPYIFQALEKLNDNDGIGCSFFF